MFQVDALAKQRFKAPITVRMPTDQVDDKGNTVYAKAHFIGHFRCLSIEEAHAELDMLTELQEAGKSREALTLAAEKIQTFFTGFEKHPKHDFPFLDGDQPLVSSTESIKRLLNSKEIREAVQEAYSEARKAEVLPKNSRK